MRYNQPYLEKYKGIRSRHECPACHDKRSFAYYLNGDTGQMIDKNVGRCNHESGCGYHYTPKDYYRDNPQISELSEALKKGEIRARENSKVIARLNNSTMTTDEDITGRVNKAEINGKTTDNYREPDKIPKQYLIQSLGYNSNFVAFLCSIFDHNILESPTIQRLMTDYYLGYTKAGAVIYWQIDERNRIRTGKIMQYDPSTGKRIKNASGAIDWVHAKLKRDNVLSKDYNLVQCLFGEHLLKKYPNKVVALVESEKSALIAAGVYPEYLWIATGGKSQLSPDKLRVLRGRTVIMFPDADGYALWCEKAREMESNGIEVIVSDTLEKNASQADKDAKIDLADWLIRELRERSPEVENSTTGKPTIPPTQEEKVLQHLANRNPKVHTLINALGLVGCSAGDKLRAIS